MRLERIPLIKESDTFTAGEEPTVVDTNVGRIGIGICHDIRFLELTMLYIARGFLICSVSFFFFPFFFCVSTGEMLWELEQRAREVSVFINVQS
ncbi:unnamed protein product [Coffea canephora]|uniref:CN hydrolase domain-containing protein n=1 Tax=Coffea canephora TaxID=49390 RepID=A0A068TP99_COFCA|nr:unnamed protein product [Coffea canephora]